MNVNHKIKSRFPYLSDTKVQEIVSHGQVIALNPGEIFIQAGERTNKVGLVLEGLMRNYILCDNGREITVVFASAMQPVASYAGIFLNQPSSEASKAVEHSILFSIDFDIFKNNLESDPIYTRVYSDLVQEALVAAIARIEDFAKKSPEERYLRLMDTHAYLIDRAPLKHLASYIGITPVSLSRIRRRMATCKA